MTTLIPKFDFQNGGTIPAGAINRPINEKLQETVSGADFGMSPSATAAENKAALLAAINSSAYGLCVYIPAGTYQIEGDITWTKQLVEIRGVNSKYTYYPIALTEGTTLVFTSGTTGFSLVSTDSDFSAFRDITIDGSSTVATGIDIGGCKYCANITVQNFTGIGIGLDTLTNSSIIENCGVFDNGVGIKAASVSVGSITPFTIKNCNVRRNYTGITIEGGTLIKIDKCIIESNTHLGLYVNCQTGESVGQITIDNTWFENNGYVDGDYAVIVTQDTGGDVYNVEFRNCLFDTPSYHDVFFQYGSYHSMYRCRFSLGGAKNINVGGNASYVQFVMCNRGIGTGTSATNIDDSGTFTYIQDYPFQFTGPNLVTTWANDGTNPYSGFTATGPHITALNQSATVTSKVNSNTWTSGIGQTYFVQIWINQTSGQIPTVVIRNGDNSATLVTQQLVNGLNYVKFTESVSGTAGYMYLTNTAATVGGTYAGVSNYETIRGYINYTYLP